MSDTQRWPTFFIAGTGRAGTTSLWRYLNQHPEVFMPSWKEPHYYTPFIWEENTGTRFGTREAACKYGSLFLAADDAQEIGEASSGYLWHEETPHLIHEDVPDAKIVISLRDPVERAYSHYLRNRGVNQEPLSSFEAAVHAELEEREATGRSDRWYVDQGFYCEQVQRYIKCFGEENVLILMFSSLREDTSGTMVRVCEFLGIDSEVVASINTGKAYNPYRQPRNWFADFLIHSEAVSSVTSRLLPEGVKVAIRENVLMERPEKPPLEESIQHELEELYEPDIARLEEFLGRELPTLRESWGE